MDNCKQCKQLKSIYEDGFCYPCFDLVMSCGPDHECDSEGPCECPSVYDKWQAAEDKLSTLAALLDGAKPVVESCHELLSDFPGYVEIGEHAKDSMPELLALIRKMGEVLK